MRTIRPIEWWEGEITGGYWKHRQDINRDVTCRAVYERFVETHRFAALSCTWKEGQPNRPHIFWDSDVAKWMEGASYLLHAGAAPELEAIVEGAIDQILKNGDEHGYFNSHFLVTRQDERFRHRDDHELYCAGHLMEAAVAYAQATGRDRFLQAMCRYADYIEQVFQTERSAGFTTPGHPEVELALMRLYRATGETRYAHLARYFIEEHGRHGEGQDNAYYTALQNQDDLPVRARSTPEGHCVRALYLLCGAADVAAEFGDAELQQACERCFDHLVQKRIYLTGGVGSTHLGEAFTVDYDLPNRTAYAETCASIALALFANRMLAFGADSKYGDAVERALYNGILSGVSQDGASFFYENPLEIDLRFHQVHTAVRQAGHAPLTQRVAVFDCSCCPPNLLRTIASVSGFLYGFDDETVYVHQYMDSRAEANGIRLCQKTGYPKDGRVRITCAAKQKQLALRIPGWCRSFRINRAYTVKNGYAYLECSESDEILVEWDMPVRLVAANRRVHADAGRVAVMRGPVVYCAEGVDNGADLPAIRLDRNAAFTMQDSEWLLPVLRTPAYRPVESEALYGEVGEEAEIPLTLIPYHLFANRGESDLQVWFLIR